MDLTCDSEWRLARAYDQSLEGAESLGRPPTTRARRPLPSEWRDSAACTQATLSNSKLQPLVARPSAVLRAMTSEPDLGSAAIIDRHPSALRGPTHPRRMMTPTGVRPIIY
jgi:hypothetical protein